MRSRTKVVGEVIDRNKEQTEMGKDIEGESRDRDNLHLDPSS